MADQPGIDVMRQRIERARRQAPAPRRPVAQPDAAPAPTTPGPASVAVPSDTQTTAPPRATARPRQTPAPRARRSAPVAEPVRLSPDAPPVNLAIRVRRPLDDRLAETIHQLRRGGIRTSKVELIEMLLWEMPGEDDGALRDRLRRFREWAPRGTGAPIEDAR